MKIQTRSSRVNCVLSPLNEPGAEAIAPLQFPFAFSRARRRVLQGLCSGQSLKAGNFACRLCLFFVPGRESGLQQREGGRLDRRRRPQREYTDVLFGTNSAALKTTGRERLAKVSGILLAHPISRWKLDGYTDSTGDPMFNEQLSQQRAAAVRSYLTQQGVPGGSVSIHGFGEANPIASNDTASGRQQNRRAELVVSGESIGTR
jgi:outer membrane protein OmpA-like peptidoglycan-associated protein